jgi:tRNA modification GTPase
LAKIKALLDEIEEVLAAQGHSERLREGLVVAIAGAPNVGKSTLLNQLARREVAIVSPHAGTTRDIIEVQLDLDGYPVTLIDTAGIRQTDDPVEQEGVRRAAARSAEADLVLWLVDGISAGAAVGGGGPVWTVRTKIDLDAGQPDLGQFDFPISASRGDGVKELVSALAGFAGDYFGSGEGSLIGRQRHRELLREASILLRRSIIAADRGEEFVAEDLRAAGNCLGRLLGRVDVEDILDKIFRDFCIGK